MKITRIEEQEGVDCEMRNFWKIKHCSSNAFSSTELQSATAVRLCLKYQQQSYDCSHGYAFGVLSCQKLLVLLRFETMLCTLSTNSSKDILNAIVCPCSTILYSMGDSGLSTVHIYTYLIFWCQNVVWLRITCRWICPTSLLHAWKCTTVGCGSFHGQYWTLHTVFRKEKTATSPWSICFVCAAMRAQQPLPLPFRIKIPSIQSSADVSGRVHVAPDLIRLPCALFSLDLSGRRILWRSPRKKTNTDVSTMFGVALGQNSQSARGICSSAQLSPTQNVRSHTTCQLDMFIFISFYLTSLHKTFQKQILSAKTRQLVFLHIHSVQPWILRTAGIVHIVHGLRVEHQAYSTTRTCRWQIQKDVPKEPQNRNPELIFQKFRETDQTDIQISCTWVYSCCIMMPHSDSFAGFIIAYPSFVVQQYAFSTLSFPTIPSWSLPVKVSTESSESPRPSWKSQFNDFTFFAWLQCHFGHFIFKFFWNLMKFVVCPHACCCPPSPLFPACSFCLQAPSEIAGKAPHTPQLDLAHRSHWLRTQLKDGVKCSSCTHGHMVKRTARTTIRRNAEGNGDKKEKAKRDVKSMKTDKKREKKKNNQNKHQQ